LKQKGEGKAEKMKKKKDDAVPKWHVRKVKNMQK